MSNEVLREIFIKVISQCGKLILGEAVDWTKGRLRTFLEFDATIIRLMLRKRISVLLLKHVSILLIFYW
jgi:hypothetical protein